MHWNDPTHFELPFAQDHQLPELLRNPPWRAQAAAEPAKGKTGKSGKAIQLAPLGFDAQPLPSVLQWTPDLAELADAGLAEQAKRASEGGAAIDVAEMARILRAQEYCDYQRGRSQEATAREWMTAFEVAAEARDVEGLYQSVLALQMLLLAERKSKWYDLQFLSEHVMAWPRLGDLAVPLFTRFAVTHVFQHAAPLITALGLDALPGLRAWAQRDFASIFRYLICFGDEALAREAASAAFAGKAAAKHGRAWLRRWPQYAAAVLLPDALRGKAKPQAQARALLIGLANSGHREPILAEARRMDASQGNTEVSDATKAMLDVDPLSLHPAKVDSHSVHWWSESWPMPVLRTGERIGLHAVGVLGDMLTFPSEDGRYAGLAQVKALCTPDSLDGFCHQLLQSWLRGNAKNKWGIQAIAVLGSDAMAAHLAKEIRQWPSQGLSARAAMGLEVLADMGSDMALREIAKIAEKVKSAALQYKARAMMDEIALARGLSAADLADRLVPDFELDAKGQTLLDFGPRQFLLGVDEQLKPFVREVVDGVPGRPLAKLPAPKVSDDAVLANAAIKRYKHMAKESKVIASSQIKRLEHAMRMGRRWSVDEFSVVYAQHPLLRQLATRLIWGVYAATDPSSNAPHAAAGQPVLASFRLSTEGEWLDAGESPLDLQALAAAPEAQPHGLSIGVVHPLELPAETVAAHTQQLADYELLQPFEQLAREVVRDLTPEAHETRITQALAKPFEPLKLLGLESRGWVAERDSGMIRSFVTPLRGGGTLVLWIDHGIMLGAPKESGLQDANASLLGCDRRKAAWAEVPALTVSDVLRDLAQVA